MSSSRVSGTRLDQLLQNAREPAFWLNRELKLVWVNRAWEELTGHPATEALGLVCGAHGPDDADGLAGLAGSLYPPPEAVSGRPAGARTLFKHPGGERRWRRVEYWPFHNASGELSALLGLVRPADDTPLLEDSEGHRLRAELCEARERMLNRHGTDSLVGRGPAHRRLLDQLSAAASSDVPVLLVGEPGTGKRTIARVIHRLGPRALSPVVTIDSAALPPDVLERALFGSGDDATGSPALSVPEGSTLLLTDVLSLPRDLQGRLTAALDGRVRLIATATNEPEPALRSERLRIDFYYTLTTLVIRPTPLRERLDELPILAQHLLQQANLRGPRQRSGFSREALRSLLEYDWPGNLAELARVVDEAHGRGETDEVQVDDIPAGVRGNLAAAYLVSPAPVGTLDDLLTHVERRLIENVLARARNNKSRAAELLGISRPRLYRRIKELNLPDEPEPGDEVVAVPEEQV